MVKFVFGTGRLSSKDFLDKYSRNRNLGKHNKRSASGTDG